MAEVIVGSLVVLRKAASAPSRPVLESCSGSAGRRKIKVRCKPFLTHRQARSHLTAPPPSTSATLTVPSRKFPPGGIPEGGSVSRVHYDTGVTLSAGESLQVDVTIAVSHTVIDFFDETTHKPVFFQPGDPDTLSCRITASA
jgi:hypothetical protein